MIEINVCIGTACHINGAHNVVSSFLHMIEENGLHDRINLGASFCMRKCANKGVSVMLNGEKYHIQADSARSFFREKVLPLIGLQTSFK